jgi:hypothetical protein
MTKTIITVTVFFVVLVGLAQADTLTVGLTPGYDYATIQAAIDDSNDGDTIIVHPGLYGEDINFLGKNITLTSTHPADPNIAAATCIGGEDGNEAVVVFRGTEEPNCTLTGFNINGLIVGYDGHINPGGNNHTHATISHCILQGNCGGCGTVILYCDGTISNCLIADNSPEFCTGGCFDMVRPAIFGCHGLIKNCTVANYIIGLEVEFGGTTTIQNCIFYNGWRAIELSSSTTVNIVTGQLWVGRL